ncbi:MAG: N-acetylmannosaminyltransferase [Candidatus Epulonipiscium fishelsonii]|nr:MAG: N-acetylmannosaminyltransferase [Epulopiscium sp. AS2M-Bin002]
MRKRITILGIQIDDINMKKSVKKFKKFMNQDKLRLICTPNPEIIMRAREDLELKNILNHADLVIPDGIGVVIASKILYDKGLTQRVAGYDLIQNTMKQSQNGEYKYFFLGGKPNIAKLAAKKMRHKYPNIKVVGYNDGYFSPLENESIIEKINNSNANILLVGFGAPKQEIWIKQNKYLLKNIKVAIGVGGSFDVMSGTTKRAPKIFIKFGLEWLYRLFMQPTRLKRMLVLPKFLLEVVKFNKNRHV